MWDLGWLIEGEGEPLPRGLEDPRPGIWVSYVPAAEVEADPSALLRLQDHRLVALPEHPWEALKIGAGPPPLRVEGGWLLVHHGVTGVLERGTDLQQAVHYAAGAMLLDERDVSRVLARSTEPLLAPETTASVTGSSRTWSSRRPSSRAGTGRRTSSTGWPTAASASPG